MKPEMLEKYINKWVKVTIFDGTTYIGEFRRGKSLGFGHIDPNAKWYCILEEHISFRASHIKEIEVVWRGKLK